MKASKKNRLKAYLQILLYDRYLDGTNCPDSFYQDGLTLLEKSIRAYQVRFGEGRRLSLHKWASAHNLLNAYNIGI